MLEQTATVVAVENGQLVLETRPQTTCQSCAVNQGCGTAVLGKSVGQKVIHFRLENTIGARKGDTVVLGLPENAVLRGSTILYLLPLLVMIATAVIADAAMAQDADNRDLAIALLSLLSVGASVLLGRLLLRHGGKRADREQACSPVLLRKQLPVA